MPKRSSRFRRAFLAAVAVFAVGLLALHLRYPLPYVYKVVVYQNPDFDDVHRFPARPIAASEFPGELPVEPDSRVAGLVE
ncbi:MAG: hypothetical protein HKP50_13765 [Myxococcales bacterium]|nr:hypothetical protein [Myxococcales bacterium]